jgi:hypothetical protein
MNENEQNEPIHDEKAVLRDNSGREIEDTVAAIEQAMVPHGFKVDVRKPIFNEDGGQIAEFDIVISGTLGTIPVELLIECRDRPSQGKQPASWIEQLVGRRDRFKFASVVAVSTTGFADPAIDYANSAGIILRNVTRISEISNDYELFEEGHKGGVEITSLNIAEDTAPRIFKANPEQGFPGDDLISLKRLIIRIDGREDFEEFPTCLLDQLLTENPQWISVPLADVEKFISVKLSHVDIRLEDGRIMSLDQITANLVFRRIHFRGKTIHIGSYSELSNRIGYYALYATQTPLGNFISSVYFALDKDGTERAPIVLWMKVVAPMVSPYVAPFEQ